MSQKLSQSPSSPPAVALTGEAGAASTEGRLSAATGALGAGFLIAPPEKGDGIRYTQYSLLYQAAVSGDSILSLMYHQLD